MTAIRESRTDSRFATGIRGWGEGMAFTEQRLKDLGTFRRSCRRRWSLIAGGAAIVGLGWLSDLVRAESLVVAAVVASFAAANVALDGLQRRSVYRWWLVYVHAGLDVGIVCFVIALVGHGGLVAGLLLAILPYTFDQGRRMGEGLVLLAALGYLAAAALHIRLFEPGPDVMAPAAFVETVAFIVVALALKATPASLIERIRVARAAMSEAEAGDLGARAPGTVQDELGFLERSFNRMLEQIAATISIVQREADEVAAYAEQLAASVEQMHATSETVGGSASGVARELREQSALTDVGRTESGKAAQQAETLRIRSEMMEADGTRLLKAAERGRERVHRASTTLRTIGEEVRSTAQSVGELVGMSGRIGKFAETIARIARQTHLLALNAAIEAAQADVHGQGFAVVAEEVRALAGEAARSAREAAEVISELRQGIAVAGRAMQSGETGVRDVGAIAEEADEALRELEEGVTVIGDLVRAAAEVSRSQATRLASLAETLTRVATISRQSSTEADRAATVIEGQIPAMSDLTATSQQLAQLAERLRASIARFSVIGPGTATREHPVPPPVPIRDARTTDSTGHSGREPQTPTPGPGW